MTLSSSLFIDIELLMISSWSVPNDIDICIE